MKALVVIPARMESVRFPGKPLHVMGGKPMIQWVVEASEKANIEAEIVVATQNKEIYDFIESIGRKAIMTSFDHLTGTDRLAEVAQKIDADFYINVQGDEPLINPIAIETCAKAFKEVKDLQFASVYCECKEEEINDPNVVKVVTDLLGYALYFSRSLIPHPRNATGIQIKKHLGLYGYTKDALVSYSKWKSTPVEGEESLEQLRFMENGIRPFMSLVPPAYLAVDTPEQAEIVHQILMSRAE